MADNEITVDALAIEIVADANTAAASITTLTEALSALQGILGPTISKLAALPTVLGKINAASMKAASKVSTVVPSVSTMAAPTPTALQPNYLSALAPTTQIPSMAPAVAEVGAASAVAAATTKTAFEKIRGSVGGVTDAVRSKVSSLTQRLVDLGRAGPKAMSTLGGSFIQLRSTIFFAFFAIGALIGMFKVFIGNATGAIERMNLFAVAFGKLRNEAEKFATTISTTLGIDPMKFKEMYSTFYLMASSLGMVAKSAQTVAQNFTQLAYDYASLFDTMDFDTVAMKFRSAMAGQTRAIAAFGLDVTIASLQEEAFREGIKTSVKEMTKANKIILMHNLIVRNSARVQQDLARTLNSPANMMRILKDQFVVAARSIGYLFIPMLKAVLPWLIAFAQAVNIAAQSLLGLFGIRMPSWKDFTQDVSGAAGGTDDLFDGMEGVTDATNKAADAAKRLKDYTLGIDELNILSPEVPSAAGGGGTGGGGGVTIEPFDVYDMLGGIKGLEKLLEPVKAAFAKVKAALDPFIKAVKRLWEALKPFIKNVWKGFTDFYKNVLIPLAVWTMNTAGVWVLERVREILEWFNAHPGAAKALGGVFAALTALKGLDVIISIVSKIGSILASVFSIKFLGVIAANIATFLSFLPNAGGAIGVFFTSLGAGEGILASLAAALGISVGWIVAIVAAVVVAGVLIINNWDKIKKAAGWLWDKIKLLWEGVVEAWDAIKEKTSGVWKWIGGFLKTIWGIIKVVVLVPVALIWAAIVAAWNTIKSVTKTAWDWVYSKIKGPLEAVWRFMRPILNLIKDTVKTTWEGLTAGLSGAWGTIKSVFKSGVNFIIRMINNGPIKMLNTVLHWAKKVPGTKAILGSVGDITPIPYLATGGGVPEGQLFRAGEHGKAELLGEYQGRTTVMPLEDSGFIEAMGKAVYSAVAAAMSTVSFGSNGDVYMDGTKVGKVLDDNARRRGTHATLVNVST